MSLLVFLSGGIDSTLCAALIRKYFGKDIHSYSIGFEGDSTSEHGVAEKTASIIGAKHSTQMLRKSDLFAHSVNYITNLDEPNGDRSCVPTYLLCKHARTEVTVALGGDGGDELFGGYSRYPNLNKMINEGSFHSPLDSLKAYFSDRLPVLVFSLLQFSVNWIQAQNFSSHHSPLICTRLQMLSSQSDLLISIVTYPELFFLRLIECLCWFLSKLERHFFLPSYLILLLVYHTNFYFGVLR